MLPIAIIFHLIIFKYDMNILLPIEAIFTRKKSIVIIIQAINTIIFWESKVINMHRLIIEKIPKINKKIVQNKNV